MSKRANKGGRPPLDRPPHQHRMLGRVPDEDWDELKSAAAKAGKPFSRWATEILLRAARRVLKGD